MDTRSKILDASQAARWLDEVRSAGQSLVIAAGWFDILRAEHCRCLQSAKPAGACLLVIVFGDSAGRSTVLDQTSRSQLVAALAVVDRVAVCAVEDQRSLLNGWSGGVIDADAAVTRDVVRDVLQQHETC
jgi:glycerol-3-phosphate cytidylyltransferase-like family protein